MAVLRYGLLLAIALAPLIASAEELDPWIGKMVLLKPGVVPTHNGLPVDVRYLSRPDKVEVVQNDRVWCQRAWVKKADLMDMDEALALSDEQIKTDPTNAKAWRLRGLAWLGKRESLKGIYSLNEAIRLAPTFSEAFVDRAIARAMRGEFLSSYEDLTQAIRLDPTDPFVYLRRGYYKALNQELDEAVQDYDRAIELDPQCDQAFKNRGDISFKRGNYKSAIDDLSEAIRIHPQNDGAFRTRAFCWFQLRNLDKALRDTDQAIRINPRSDSAYHARAACWIEKEGLDNALKDISQSIELNPNILGSYQIRAHIYERQRNYRKAIHEHETCCQLFPGDPRPIVEMAFFLAASPDDGMRDGKRAIELATKACEMTEWQNDSAIAALATAHAEVGEWDDAIRYQKSALDKAPAYKQKRRQENLQLFEKKCPMRFTPANAKEYFNPEFIFVPE